MRQPPQPLRLFPCLFLLSAVTIMPTTNAFVTPNYQPQIAPATSKTALNGVFLSRRDWFQQATATTTTAVTVASAAAVCLSLPAPSNAAASVSTSVRVEEWPGLEYLEPVYELRLSIQVISQGATDKSKYPLLKQRMDQFFSGGLFSERNYYAGLGVQYMGQIKYDPNELPEYIKMDKEERFTSMEDTLNSLKDLWNTLKQKKSSSTEGQLAQAVEEAKVQTYIAQAKANLDRWFALVPESDVEKVGQLFVAVRNADANRNGKLEDEELATLSEGDCAIWKRRSAYVGG